MPQISPTLKTYQKRQFLENFNGFTLNLSENYVPPSLIYQSTVQCGKCSCDFEVNQTKIKGGCQLGRKVVPHDSKSDLPLGMIFTKKNIQFQFADFIKWYFNTKSKSNYVGLMAFKVCLKCKGANEEFLCLANWSISSISAFSSSSLTGSIRDNDRLKG